VPVETRGGRCRAALCTSGRGSGAFPALYRKAICTKRDSVGFISINTAVFLGTNPEIVCETCLTSTLAAVIKPTPIIAP